MTTKKNLFYTVVISLFISATVLTTSSSNAVVLSSPSLNLDGAVASSLATSSPTQWRDLVTSGATALPLGANTSYSSEGGGSIAVNGTIGSTGAYLAPTTIGASSNPVGNMTLMAWVKPTSWNVDWNIIASRWFADFAGSSNGNDFHFAIRSNGAAHSLNLYTTNLSNSYGSYNFALNSWYLVGFTLATDGTLKFYVNGQPDGSAISGAGHTTYATTYLFVGDLRNTCSACSINGFIGKFRMWNSVLTPTQIAADYQNEAANFGYGTTTTLSLASPTPRYRNLNTITATVSQAGKVTFMERGKRISGCTQVSAASTTATCAWRPLFHGPTSLSASYTPTNPFYVGSSNSTNLLVSARVNTR